MDMTQAMLRHNIEQIDRARDESDLKLILVAPAGDSLPDDGQLEYRVAVNVGDLLSVKDGSVLLFEEKNSDLLEMLVKHQLRFDCKVKVLAGLPNSSYSSWFNGAVWSLDEVSYAGFLSELALEMNAERELIERSQTVHDVERSRYTRSNGTVKDQNRFDVVASSTSIDDAIAKEE